MGKSAPRERHLFPADNNADHTHSPWCPCKPTKRIQRKPVPTLIYVHHDLPDTDAKGAR